MKPFDLKAALAGAKVVTRDRRKVKIAGYNEDAEGLAQITGWIGNKVGNWSKEGRYYLQKQSNFDLFMAEDVVKEWVVCYGKSGASRYKNKITADEFYKLTGYRNITVHEITIHE